MCGRFELNEPSRILARYPHLRFDSDFPPRYNVAPTQTVAGTCNDDPTRVVPLYWGFIPPWDSHASRFSTINAKAETLDARPLYRTALHSTRAVIWAGGFFEWQRIPGSSRKQPLLIRLKSQEPFPMAALWQSARSQDGQVLRLATVVTVPANTALQAIHDRMPAILTDDSLRDWLSVGDIEPTALSAALVPYRSDDIEAVPVRLLVNDVRNDTPTVIEPIKQTVEPLELF